MKLAIMNPEIPQRLADLRAEMKKRGLDGFLVPREDEFQSEFVPDSARRVEWTSGFTSPDADIVILEKKAGFFTSSFYTGRMKKDIDPALFERCSTSPDQKGFQTRKPEKWIEENLPKGARLGYDPWLHTEASLKKFQDAVTAAGGTLVACDTNPIDAIWTNRPAGLHSTVVAYDIKFSGKSSQDKRHEIAAQLDCDAAVLSLGDSVAWLLNIRGNDTPCTPFALSYAVLNRDGTVDWFVDESKFESGLNDHLGPEVRVHAPKEFEPFLKGMGKKTVLISPEKSPVRISQLLEAADAKIVQSADPCQLPKACKNAAEVTGMIECHKRDGAAVTRALARISQNPTQLTELDVADILLEERGKETNFRGISFPTIAAIGPNGADAHYTATLEDFKPLQKGTLLVIDSGGQYLDGTTDITRTIAIGKPTAEMKKRFTLVLKGHIDLAKQRFPDGAPCQVIDAFARAALWNEELNFDHATGHGIGQYLAVHEGPAYISPRCHMPLKAGMIQSNEPGYYKEGDYGIRIESVLVVRKSETRSGWLNFETIALAPIDRRLIDAALLDDKELQWLNDYHEKVRQTLTPVLDAKTAKWLAEATAPIGKAPAPAPQAKPQKRALSRRP